MVDVPAAEADDGRSMNDRASPPIIPTAVFRRVQGTEITRYLAPGCPQGRCGLRPDGETPPATFACGDQVLVKRSWDGTSRCRFSWQRRRFGQLETRSRSRCLVDGKNGRTRSSWRGRPLTRRFRSSTPSSRDLGGPATRHQRAVSGLPSTDPPGAFGVRRHGTRARFPKGTPYCRRHNFRRSTTWRRAACRRGRPPARPREGIVGTW